MLLAMDERQGMIVNPPGNLNLECYVASDFGGFYKREPDTNPESAKSRTGFILMIVGISILWK
jgi:hypothetical protein